MINSYMMKVIAVILMTMDHIAMVFLSPEDGEVLRILGRSAAPLFVFLLVQSFFYTRSREKMLVRLYLGSVITSSVFVVMAYCFNVYYNSNFMNILANLFLLLYLCERYKKSGYKTLFLWAGYYGVQLLTTVLILYLLDYLPGVFLVLLKALFFNNLLYEPFGLMFVLMGILFYEFHHNKRMCGFCCIAVSLSCKLLINSGVLYRLTSGISKVFHEISPIMGEIYDGSVRLRGFPIFENENMIFKYQWLMILVVPFLVLYDDKHIETRKYRYFAYVYYPVHCFLLYLLKFLILR